MSAYMEFQMKMESVAFIMRLFHDEELDFATTLRILCEKQKLKLSSRVHTKIKNAITEIQTQSKETCEMSKKNDSTTVDKIVIPTTKKVTASRSKMKTTLKKAATKKSVPKATAPKDKKLCTSCGITKPVSAFAKNNARADGLHGRCRSCESDYQRSRRTDTPSTKATSKKKTAPKKAAAKKTASEKKVAAKLKRKTAKK